MVIKKYIKKNRAEFKLIMDCINVDKIKEHMYTLAFLIDIKPEAIGLSFFVDGFCHFLCPLYRSI